MGTTDKADCDRGGVVSDVPAGLTAFQVSVATLFFSLPASDGFLLAGGGAHASPDDTAPHDDRPRRPPPSRQRS